jgi:hypothetical protein
MKRNRNRTGYRRVPLNKEMITMLDQQRERFIAKFGREPRGEDPILFDENADTPQPMALADIEREVLEFMAAVNVDPAFIHAYKVTGRLVSEDNLHLLTEEEIQEWGDAVAEYQRLHPTR